MSRDRGLLLTDEQRHPFVQNLEEEAIWDIDGLLEAQLAKARRWLRERWLGYDTTKAPEWVSLRFGGTQKDWEAFVGKPWKREMHNKDKTVGGET